MEREIPLHSSLPPSSFSPSRLPSLLSSLPPSIPSFLALFLPHIFVECLYHVRQSLLSWILQVIVENKLIKESHKWI